MASKAITANRGGWAYDGSGIGNSPTFNLNQIAKYGSLLNPLLEKIINNHDPDADINSIEEPPDPEEKLNFNNVKIFSEEILDCIGFLSLVEEQIDALDDEAPGSKKKFLRAINQNYKNHRRQLLIERNVNEKKEVINVIRENSDRLILSVTESILDSAIVDLYSHPVETVRDSISLIVCYGFINCKILERPDDYK